MFFWQLDHLGWALTLITWLPVGYITTRVFVNLSGMKIQTRKGAVWFFVSILLGWFILYAAVFLLIVLTVVIAATRIGLFLAFRFVLPGTTKLKNVAIVLGSLTADICWRLAPR